MFEFIKNHISEKIYTNLQEFDVKFDVDEARSYEFGDFATNAAVIIAKKRGVSPKEVADEIAALFEDDKYLEASVAGIFVNFRIREDVLKEFVNSSLESIEVSKLGLNKWHLEFGSVNPTGPVSLGHARQAAIGDTLARVLRFLGVDVVTEHYSNDAGRQVNLLTMSFIVRILEKKGENVALPEDAYHGDYLSEFASRLLEQDEDLLDMAQNGGFEGDWKVVFDIAQNLDMEFLSKVAGLLGDNSGEKKENAEKGDVSEEEMFREKFELLKNFIVSVCRGWILQTFKRFRVTFDKVFSEKTLHLSGALKEVFENLQKAELVYFKDGAYFLKTTEFGDEKDRVLIRSDGTPTYFLSDLAYHLDKYRRGFDYYITVLGQDHHEYAQRLAIGLKALGIEADKFKVVLHQFVNLKEGGKVVRMSKRSGKFVTLDELMNKVGVDPIRFFFVSKSNNSHIEFDVELAQSQTTENPVYYIQYVHARICGIERKLTEKGIVLETAFDGKLDGIKRHLVWQLIKFEKALWLVLNSLSPHHLVSWLMETADIFHKLYTEVKVADNPEYWPLFALARKYIAQGLDLIGVEAPERM